MKGFCFISVPMMEDDITYSIFSKVCPDHILESLKPVLEREIINQDLFPNDTRYFSGNSGLTVRLYTTIDAAQSAFLNTLGNDWKNIEDLSLERVVFQCFEVEATTNPTGKAPVIFDDPNIQGSYFVDSITALDKKEAIWNVDNFLVI